ncbi:unnamed protein product [Durusdinium trenchii]|uniref:Uncharacterized protein n=1 Tax=Durusdinium trenchii TaxID=1381693 RepID=A0ABP0LMV1_9DINO
MRLAEHERVSRLIEPELQRPKAAEAAKARQPKHSASTCEEQSEVPEMLPWEGLRVEEASATLPASTPSSPSRPSCPKWHVRNLTFLKERFEKKSNLNQLRKELQKVLKLEAIEEHRIAVLRLESLKQKSFITDEAQGGEDWQAISEAAANVVEQTQQLLQQAMEVHEQIQENAASLTPGAEMMRSRDDLQQAHETIQQLKKQLSQAERSREAARSLVLLHNEMDQLQNNKTKRDPHLEEIGQKVRELELDSSLTEVVKAQSTAEVMPEVILHVKPSKELCRFLEVGKALSLKTLIGLLETEWAFQFRRQGQDQNDLVLPIKPFMKALRACYPSSGRAVLLSLIGSNAGSAGSRYLQVELSSAESIRKYAGRKPDAVPSSIGLLQSLLGLNRQVHLNASLQKLIRSALCQNVDIPQNLKEILRKYQADGFRWLACNAENCIGSLLADDMGLGKTLQCAALLQYLCHEGKISVEKPALVVVPFSVLGNWKTELRRWTPSLRPKVYHGKARSLQGDAEVVITTYSILLLDQAKFISSGLQLACMVLDESQYIKNSQSLTAQAVKKVAANSGSSCARVALTGTPIENRLTELFSLFEFLNPGFLGTKEEFLVNFERPVQKALGRNGALAKLRAALEPFMLRRHKNDKAIAPELPDKVEYDYTVEMTQDQSRQYIAWAERVLDGSLVFDAEAGKSPNRQRAVLLLLHRLQQVVNHPAAVPPEHRLEQTSHEAFKSGKMTRLLELLEDIWESPEQKVLIFTQYLGTQQLLAEILANHFPNLRPLLIRGDQSFDERQKAIADFSNDPSCRVMILTLKAGGVGINLTAATHVVHFDRCWNPAKEAQVGAPLHYCGYIRRAIGIHHGGEESISGCGYRGKLLKLSQKLYVTVCEPCVCVCFLSQLLCRVQCRVHLRSLSGKPNEHPQVHESTGRLPRAWQRCPGHFGAF